MEYHALTIQNPFNSYFWTYIGVVRSVDLKVCNGNGNGNGNGNEIECKEVKMESRGKLGNDEI